MDTRTTVIGRLAPSPTGAQHVGNARTYVQAAEADYRNVLYWAEHYEEDPLLKTRNPKQMIEEILAKFRKTGVK